MAEKTKEFTEKGSEIYHGNKPDGAREIIKRNNVAEKGLLEKLK